MITIVMTIEAFMIDNGGDDNGMTDMAFFSVGGGALLLALRCAHLGRHHHQDCQEF